MKMVWKYFWLYSSLSFYGFHTFFFQTLIEANVDVKTTDGYLLRVFCIGFTNKDQMSQRKTCYAQHAQVWREKCSYSSVHSVIRNWVCSLFIFCQVSYLHFFLWFQNTEESCVICNWVLSCTKLWVCWNDVSNCIPDLMPSNVLNTLHIQFLNCISYLRSHTHTQQTLL
jgi:hypothetical protein